MAANLQLDIPATRSDWFTLPSYLPMRLGAVDFVFFHWPAELDASRYTVVIESLDTAGPQHRGISKLKESVQLPHVQLHWHSKIGVIPDSENLPSFEAELFRGSTYIIPNRSSWVYGVNSMAQHGTQRPPGI